MCMHIEIYICKLVFALRDPNWKCRHFILVSLAHHIPILLTVRFILFHFVLFLFSFFFAFFVVVSLSRVFPSAMHNLIHVCSWQKYFINVYSQSIRSTHICFRSHQDCYDLIISGWIPQRLERLTLCHIISTEM